MDTKTPVPEKQSSGPKVRQVLVVDDHPIVREGLSQLIEQEKDLSVCGTTSHAKEVVGLVGTLNPDMLLLDITLDGGNGLDVAKELSNTHPHLPILILSMHNEEVYAERAIRAGARGYQMKDASPSALLSAIRKVLEGRIHLSEAVHSKVVRRLRLPGSGPEGKERNELDRLSDRELEIFELIGQGTSTRSIAEELFISTKTVETHRANIKQKLQIADGNELVRRAVCWVAQIG